MEYIQLVCNNINMQFARILAAEQLDRHPKKFHSLSAGLFDYLIVVIRWCNSAFHLSFVMKAV